jgi:hypothetical protein
MTPDTSHNWPRFAVRSANAGHASIQSASETRDCQSGFNLFYFLESGFHGHSGSDDFTLHVSEQIARLVILIDGEFSRGCIPPGERGPTVTRSLAGSMCESAEIISSVNPIAK